MDFLEDLFDFGDRKHRRGSREHRHEHDDDFDRHHDNRRPVNDGYTERGGVRGSARCGKCAADLAASFNFCPHCGNPAPKIKKCSSCGAEITSPAKFCSSCGASTV